MGRDDTISIKDIWPQEREDMFRPDRLQYVRKLIKPEGCVFCKALEDDLSFESLVLYKSKNSMVVLNKFPYNMGHCLVLPQKHCGELWDLSAEEYDDLSQLLRQTVAAVNKAYDGSGFNIGMNHGDVAGAGIPKHLHWHVIPRWFGDTNFFPIIAETKVHPESLEQSYERIKEVFDKQ